MCEIALANRGHPRRVCDISLANRGLTPATLLFGFFYTCIHMHLHSLHHFSNRGESRTVHGCGVVLDLILMCWFVSSVSGKNKRTHTHTHTLVQPFMRRLFFSRNFTANRGHTLQNFHGWPWTFCVCVCVCLLTMI